MMQEQHNFNGTTEDSFKMGLMDRLEVKQGIIGEFQDTITFADGRVEVMDWNRNMIVNGISKLVACLMKKQSGHTGLSYWAIGQGLEEWDDNLPTAQATDERLTSEIGRKAIPASAITFVDANGQPTSGITNRIQITLEFMENECNGRWREFGIYGGNASATTNSGIMINHKIHELITKTSAMTIERKIRFTFN